MVDFGPRIPGSSIFIFTKLAFRSLVDLNKLQNEYERKLDNQEKSIQDIQEKSEELSSERTITKAPFSLWARIFIGWKHKKQKSSEHQVENSYKNKIFEIKEEILDKENEITRLKRKLNRKKTDVQEVTLVIIYDS